MKGFTWGVLFLIIANAFAAFLGLGGMGVFFGFVMGTIYVAIQDYFNSEPTGNQTQIIKDSNSIHIQASGDITVKSMGSEIVYR